MSAPVEEITSSPAPLPRYREILLATDASDHSVRATADAATLAGPWDARVTGSHVYAARMHDARFRQMEGGLPAQFRYEQELERQREVHEDLITRGLSIISDSYLDQAERACDGAQVRYARRALEGKNYRALVEEANSGDYDLLVLGALGLGAIEGSRIGSVCERTVRRTQIDTLVVKQPQRGIDDGPIAVAIDGSARAYGGLLTAFSLAREWHVPVHVLSAFDPYYHYVAFNRIAGVLSEEAGKVFRFKEQEKLHEEIIDSGLAKIYDGHLAIATQMASDHQLAIETRLLDGKPHDVIARYLRELNPSLLVIGKLGIHADPELDIGGHAESLLRNVDCAVLLSQREYRPSVERLADVTTSWTDEAEQRLQKAPSFVQGMARIAILRYAQERGHTVITERLVEEATAKLMPGRADEAIAEIVAAHEQGELARSVTDQPMQWTEAAQTLLAGIDDESVRANLARRAEKKARGAASYTVEPEHLHAFMSELPSAPTQALHWQAAALARLARVPEGFMREASRQRIEDYARARLLATITLETAEAGLDEARNSMAEMLGHQSGSSVAPGPGVTADGKCPFSRGTNAAQPGAEPVAARDLEWSAEARLQLDQVPPGFCRDMTRNAIDSIAVKKGLHTIDAGFVTEIMDTFRSGSAAVHKTLPWDHQASERIARAPESVQGMLVREIEGWTQRHARDRVNVAAVEAVKNEWRERGVFHLDPNDPRGAPAVED